MSINRFVSKAKVYWKDFWSGINTTLTTAFPDDAVRHCVLAIAVVLELLIAYAIAAIDIGIPQGDSSLWGIAAGYIRQGRWYPIWIFLFLGGALLVGGYLYLWNQVNKEEDRGFTLSEDSTYGDAREISREELEAVAEICPKEAAMGTILGQLDHTENQLITMKPNANSNNNICIFGSPGSGKTHCFVKPFILQAIRRGESVICTDSKGELWADTVEFARLHGYIIRRLDLKNPTYSDGWDFISELRHDDERALIAAQTIMRNTGNPKTNDPHAAAEEALLRACLLYVERNPSYPQEQRTLYDALRLLLQGIDNLDSTFSRYDGVSGSHPLKTAYDAYCTTKTGSPNLRGNIVANLASRLGMISSPPIQALTSINDIDLTLPGQKPCIYYCVLSDQHETMKFLASLFISFVFMDLVDFADSQMTRKLPVRTNILLEEAANIGEIPDLSKRLNTCRSRGVDIIMANQSLGQLQDIYGDKYTEAILAACATHACYGFNDKGTADYFDWRSGTATVKVRSERHAYGESPVYFGRGYSTGDGKRSYYTSNDLMKMDARKVFLVWQRENCLMANTFGCDRHMATLTGQVKTISTETSIPLTDRVARTYLRTKEQERVDVYNAWIQNGGDPWPEYTRPKPQFDGPARNEKLPEITPYPELEQAALAYSHPNVAGDAAPAQSAPEPKFVDVDDDLPEWEDFDLKEESEGERTAERLTEETGRPVEYESGVLVDASTGEVLQELAADKEIRAAMSAGADTDEREPDSPTPAPPVKRGRGRPKAATTAALRQEKPPANAAFGRGAASARRSGTGSMTDTSKPAGPLDKAITLDRK